MSTSFSLDTVMIVIRTATATANGDLGNLAIVSTACRRLRLIAAIGLFAYFPPSTLLTSIMSCSPLMMLILLPAHGIFPRYSYSYIATYYSYTLARSMLYLLFNPSTLLFVPLGYPMTYRHSFLPHVYPRSRSFFSRSFCLLNHYFLVWSSMHFSYIVLHLFVFPLHMALYCCKIQYHPRLLNYNDIQVLVSRHHDVTVLLVLEPAFPSVSQ